ncbi:heterokaryon incompatibility protein [Seiridium cupressi]
MLSYATTYSSDTNPLPPITVELLEPSLYACGLYWCAQIYDSPVAVDGMAPSNTSADFRPSALQGPEGDITVESSTGLLNVLHAQSSDVAEFPSSVNPNFTVKANSHLVLTRYLEDLFNISQSNGNDAFAVFSEPQFGLAGIIDAIYMNGEDSSDTFARIARGMTEQIRSSMSSYVAAGNSFGPETYIDIEWPWMAFPIGVFVLATVLLTTSIFASRSSKGTYHRVWKSSTLSPLLHNLEDVHVDKSALAGLQELKCFAESLEVKLSNRDSVDMRFIDAVCIGQDDDNERGHQVKFMPQIDSQAQSDFIYIGEHCGGSREIFEALELSQYYNGPRSADSPVNGIEAKAWHDLMARSISVDYGFFKRLLWLIRHLSCVVIIWSDGEALSTIAQYETVRMRNDRPQSSDAT